MTKTILKSGMAAAAALLASTSANAVVIFYQQGFSNNLWKYDTVANVETLVGAMGLNADSTGMAFAPNGTLYVFERQSQSLYRVNTTTAATTLVGNAGISAEDFTVSLDGSTGYATADGVLYAVNLSNGAATRIGPTHTMDGLTTSSQALTIAGTNYAAGSVFGVDSHSIFAVDVATGAATGIGSSNGADETFDFGGNVLYGHGDDGFLYTINLTTLVGTPLFKTTPNLVFGMAVSPGAAVPEPAAWALMIAGFGLAGAALRARKIKIAYA